MPGKPPKTYQYKTGDDPTRVAAQFGVAPRQLLDANPGGYPFSTGQIINIPNYQYTPIQPHRLPSGGFGITPVEQFSNWLRQDRNPNIGLHGAFGQTPGSGISVFPATSNNYPLHGTFGQLNSLQPSSLQPKIAQPPTPSNYNVQQRGRGYGQPTIRRGQVPDNVGNADFYKWETDAVRTQLKNGELPVSMSSATAQSLEIDPSQHGYVMQNGQWVFAGSAAQSTSTPGGGGEQSYDPRDISYTWNKYAKNPKSRFETNLKWAQNAWRRKRQYAKGRETGKQRIAKQQAQTDQTTESITGFGLVNFSASAG